MTKLFLAGVFTACAVINMVLCAMTIIADLSKGVSFALTFLLIMLFAVCFMFGIKYTVAYCIEESINVKQQIETEQEVIG